jgi:hypothetical protein
LSKAPERSEEGLKAIALALGTAVALVVVACSDDNPGPPVDGGISFTDGGGSDGASGGCHSDADCKSMGSFLFCARVEDPVCGGAQPASQCATDADCADAGANKVCVHGPCGVAFCEPRCTTDAACGSSALVCSMTSGQCEAKPCTQSSDCPTNFACTAGACAAKACTTDAECMGACVNQLCSSSIGGCRAPAA